MASSIDLRTAHRRPIQNHLPNMETVTAVQSGLVTLDLPPISFPHENNNRLDMIIRRAQPDDLSPIQTLLADLDLPHDDLTASHLSDFLVARTDDRLVGVVGTELYDDAALLRSLAVREHYRGQGLGAQLTDQIETHAREHGAETVYLLTTTAATYFGKRNYGVIPRDELPPAIQQTEEAAHLCPESATTMKKSLA